MDYLKHAIELARNSKGGPFGACLVKAGVLVEGQNEVVPTHDPTAHAEIVAIRKACAAIGSHDLSEWTLYSSCEPCPMCLGAIQWARIKKVVYAATRFDAQEVGFDDVAFYGRPTISIEQGNLWKEAREMMLSWKGQIY
ncbi:MAG: nucleoside deaminase [Candidatus Omnitrophota bacterium]|jgi:tRNA(Arg) A34 adenosine deaminase TadA